MMVGDDVKIEGDDVKSSGDDVAVPALGLTNSVGCVCSLFWLMLSFSVLPCLRAY
jgi:hypothetical protein